MRAAANSPASASMAATTSIKAAVSSASSRVTVGDRLGLMSSKPSCAKVLISSGFNDQFNRISDGILADLELHDEGKWEKRENKFIQRPSSSINI
jgi:hypothetical protein